MRVLTRRAPFLPPSQWPGHPRCLQYIGSGPQAQPLPFDADDPYRWREVLGLNRIMAHECEHGGSGCTLHDLERMSSLRPDSHMHWRPTNPTVDCAHWCVNGGPLEWANVLLQNQLWKQRARLVGRRAEREHAREARQADRARANNRRHRR